MGKIKKSNIVIPIVFICLIMATIGSASAYSSISTNKNVNLVVANDLGVRFNINGDNTYNFFSTNQNPGQGLNALHIAPNTGTSAGTVTQTNDNSGTFFMSDTGGRGWDDDGILMIAVNGTMDSLANLSITINASGYVWTPVPTGSYPSYSNTTYLSTLNETFDASDFNGTSGYISVWKPCPYTDYALYEGQSVSQDNQSGNTFHIIFVDCKAGIIGTNTLSSSTWSGQPNVNNGMLNVTYSVSGLPQNSLLSFNDYAFCNSSNQGQGIRWTNSVNVLGTNSSATSGWNVASWF